MGCILNNNLHTADLLISLNLTPSSQGISREKYMITLNICEMLLTRGKNVHPQKYIFSNLMKISDHKRKLSFGTNIF